MPIRQTCFLDFSSSNSFVLLFAKSCCNDTTFAFNFMFSSRNKLLEDFIFVNISQKYSLILGPELPCEL